ncbi:MAG: proline racemase family protein [Desulfobacterales bacterium]|nr:proline racemase family protein [Desulfobacterales bacterium]
MKEHHDRLRTALMWEPRGHADMYGCIVTPPVSPGADIGILFMHNEGYSTMCGHGIIAITKVVLETGLVSDAGAGDHGPHRQPGRPDHRACPGGSGGEVDERLASKTCPPSCWRRTKSWRSRGSGRVRCDIAFGGAFYAYVDARPMWA